MNRQSNRYVKQMRPEVSDRVQQAQRAMEAKAEAKAEAKLWPSMTLPLQLSDALTGLTKSDLSDIRSNLGVRNASSLNKPDLVALLATQIPVLLPDVLGRMDEDRYAVLKRLANAGGQAHVSLEPQAYRYFKLRGLAFTGAVDGTRVLVMPQEVVEAFRAADSTSLHTVIRRNTEWLRISQGLLYYYGYIEKPELIRMVGEFAGTQVDLYDYLAALYDAIRYGYNIDVHADGFSHENVIDIKQVLLEHQSRPDLPFYPFTKSQLMRAGKPGFVDKNRAYRTVVDFLRRNFDVELSEAESEAELCLAEIQNGESLAQIIQDISYDFEIPSMEVLQDLTEHMAQLYNSARQWFLKGHTPSELMPADRAALRSLPETNSTSKGEVISMTTKKKVGRNEPCPCGSGKKYKKCCGR